MKKVLICGNAPTLPEDLKGVKLDMFDKVVRSNFWQPIEGYDNRCDIHVFSINQALLEKLRLEPKDREYWCPFRNVDRVMLDYTGKKCDWVMKHSERKRAVKEIGAEYPTTGAFAIWHALDLGWEVYIAGFTFFEEHFDTEDREKIHYFKEQDFVKMMKDTRHDPSVEKIWVYKLMREGKVHKVSRIFRS